MNGYTFSFGVLLLTLAALLGWLASRGSLAAGIALAVVGTVALVALGAGITLAVQRMANEKSQADFVNNAKENLMLMQQAQRVQNLQNQTIMDQLNRAARLPEPSNGYEPAGGLLIDSDIFAELDQ